MEKVAHRADEDGPWPLPPERLIEALRPTASTRSLARRDGQARRASARRRSSHSNARSRGRFVQPVTGFQVASVHSIALRSATLRVVRNVYKHTFANAVVVFPVVQPLRYFSPLHGLSVEGAIINRSAHNPCMSLPIRQFLPDRERNLVQFKRSGRSRPAHLQPLQEGWLTGFEPATAATTTRSSTS